MGPSKARAYGEGQPLSKTRGPEERMPTLNQLSGKKGRKKKKGIKKVNRIKGLGNRPQRKGICVKIYEVKPRKPNSARRKVCRIRFTSKSSIKGGVKNYYEEGIAYIPGEKHNLEEYSRVLVQGGNTQDVPGLKLKALRGHYDLAPVAGRTHGRSKFGVKKS